MKKILCIILFPLLITGCWDYVPLEKNLIITSIGIDIDEKKPDLIEVTFSGPEHSKRDAAQGPMVSQTSKSSDYFHISATGKSISGAISAAQRRNHLNISIHNLRVLMISEAIAKQGILRYLDLFFRTSQITPNVYVVIAKGKTNELLSYSNQMISNVTSYTIDLLESTDFETNKNKFTVKELIYVLHSNHRGFILPYFILDSKEKRILFDNVCLFKEDRMISTLNPSESLSYFLAGDILDNVWFSLDKEHTDNLSDQGTGFYLFPQKRKIFVTLSKNIISISLDFTVDANISEEIQGTNDMSPKEDFSYAAQMQKTRSYERQISQILQQNVMALLQKLQTEYKVDSMGFGEYFRVKFPEEYAKTPWEMVFPNVKFDVDVNVRIHYTGTKKLG